MIHLATYFDRSYLTKGRALIRSLERHVGSGNYHLYVLALDDDTWEATAPSVRRGRPLTVVRLEALENHALMEAKARRSWREYIFTLTPFWCHYLLSRLELPSISYIDADCYLFADLAAVYGEIGTASIAACPHRWTPKYADRLRPNGLFNVGLVYFRDDEPARHCLATWEADCLSYRPGPFSDQVFLDAWPDRYGRAFRSISHLGANLAPWNQEQYEYEFRHQQIYVVRRRWTDDMGIEQSEAEPLIWYHFHEFRHERGTFFRTGYPLHPFIAKHVYPPYEQEVADVTPARIFD